MLPAGIGTLGAVGRRFAIRERLTVLVGQDGIRMASCPTLFRCGSQLEKRMELAISSKVLRRSRKSG
jgi:hypothetical protein